MPSRMIRETLLSSDRFLSLPDNTSRMCYIVCLLTVDDRGNIEASDGQLVRMWRDFGIDSSAKALATLQLMCDQDLTRVYELEEKRYIHIPRFGQRLRHLVRACPPSPWCEKDEENQGSDFENVRRTSGERQTNVSLTTAEVKRSEVKRREGTPRQKRRSPTFPMPEGFEKGPSERVIAWAEERDIRNIDKHLENFVSAAKAKGYVYVDWDEAFMTAVRKDWAQIGDGRKRVSL